MTHRLLALYYILTYTILAQDVTPDLASFFQQRLVSSAPPPSYEALLAVVDTIPSLPPKRIQEALPSIWTALESSKENLAIEAVFALHEIATRPDGSSILRTGIQHLGGVLADSDERVAAGSIETLKSLSVADGDLTMPVFTAFLKSSTKLSLIKVEAASALLHFRPTDKDALNSVELFLKSDMQPDVQAHALQAVAANHVSSPAIGDFVIRSLSSANDDVKTAAIPVAREIGPGTWGQALPIITKLATSPSESSSVHAVAERELENSPDRPSKQ